MIVVNGAFSIEVASRLAEPDERQVLLSDFLREPPQLSAGERVILLSATPAFDAFRRFAQMMEEAHREWTLGYLNGQQAICGPKFGPAPGPCFDCYFKRMLSHLPDRSASEQEIVAGRFYSRDLSRDHPGMLATAAWVMSDECRRIVGEENGRVFRFDVLDIRSDEGRVIPLHGCRRCRGQDRGSDRFVERLAKILPAGVESGY